MRRVLGSGALAHSNEQMRQSREVDTRPEQGPPWGHCAQGAHWPCPMAQSVTAGQEEGGPGIWRAEAKDAAEHFAAEEASNEEAACQLCPAEQRQKAEGLGVVDFCPLRGSAVPRAGPDTPAGRGDRAPARLTVRGARTVQGQTS